MSKLYELAADYRELVNMEDMDPQAIADTLEGIVGSVEKKAEAIVAVRAGMAGNIKLIDNEIKRLTDRKQVIENQEAALRKYLKDNMQRMKMKNISCPLFSITLAKGRDTVFIEDEDLLPDECVGVTTTIKPDKKLIGEKLKSGKKVPGARLVKSDDSIRIK